MFAIDWLWAHIVCGQINIAIGNMMVRYHNESFNESHKSQNQIEFPWMTGIENWTTRLEKIITGNIKYTIWHQNIELCPEYLYVIRENRVH